jgi:hypothetical protein
MGTAGCGNGVEVEEGYRGPKAVTVWLAAAEAAPASHRRMDEEEPFCDMLSVDAYTRIPSRSCSRYSLH